MSAESRDAFAFRTAFPDIEHVVCYLARCSLCGHQADQDGEEYAATPQLAADAVLDNSEWQARDGRLVCGECIAAEMRDVVCDFCGTIVKTEPRDMHPDLLDEERFTDDECPDCNAAAAGDRRA